MRDVTIISGALVAGIMGGSLYAASLIGGQHPRQATTASQPAIVAPAPNAPGVVAVGPGAAAVAAPVLSQPELVAKPVKDRQSAPAELKPLPLPQVAAPVGARPPQLVSYEIETKEITALMDEGVSYIYWTFGDSVPGPMLRVRQGDTVELTLKNSPESKLTHSIDLHGATGPGGGAKVTQVAPGESATFRFKALNPGVYVYHCATPMVPHHIASGMYGLIVVEPPEGLAPVDREYYVMQGEFYLDGVRDEKGLHEFAMEQMLNEKPSYVVFNGSVGALAGSGAFKANVGETVRIFFGVGGPNTTSSFHVIGEIFDRVYAEGASEYQTNVQTTMVPAGGATVVEFKLDVPGTYILVDHSLGRLVKGAAGMIEVAGPDNPEVFQPIQVPAHSAASSGH